ncbi:hypothetical protein DIPPA_28303 [Diplonema papillatum]|nr:hypothetical protein DIPPA_28303 [Diplonema papillatum]
MRRTAARLGVDGASRGTVGAGWAGEDVAFEMGRMVSHCYSQHAAQLHFKWVVSDGVKPAGGASAVPPLVVRDARTQPCDAGHPSIIGLDVEMVTRTATREKVPIKGALVRSVFSSGSFHTTTQTWNIDPMAPLTANEYDWKTETHGVTPDAFFDLQSRNELTPLPEVQQQIAAALQPRATMLVGHMLSNDLLALKLQGAALRHKIVDTAFYFGPRPDGGAISLRQLAANKLGSEELSFDRDSVFHDPLEDAVINTRIAEMEVTRLLEGGVPPLVAVVPKASSTCSVFLMHTSDGRELIGPGGKNLKRVRQVTGATVVVCTMSMPSRDHYFVTVTSPSRVVHPVSVDLVTSLMPGKLVPLPDGFLSRSEQEAGFESSQK